ncbi:MAG: hypothetical protein ABJH63_04520 [Rhizobiaceae bacterium]
MSVAELLIVVVQLWGAAGAVVAALFLFIGIDRVDPAAHDAYAFRPLLIPGILVIWPLVLWRWWSLEKLARDGCPAAPEQRENGGGS